MDTNELDRMIVINLPELDAAMSRIKQLGDTVWRCLGEHVEEWGKLNGWEVSANSDTIRLAPPGWSANLCFYFAWGSDDDDSGKPGQPSSWLARIAGVSGGELCLWLEQGAGARTWKPIANGAQAEASGLGFRLSDAGNFFASCTLDRAALSEALADDQVANAFQPVDKALNLALAAAPLFTQLYRKAGQL